MSDIGAANKPSDRTDVLRQPEESGSTQELPLPKAVADGEGVPLLARPLAFREAMLWALAASVSFHLAYTSTSLSYFILPYLLCLVQLARLPSPRQAFYLGLATGLVCVGPQLFCFWVIFGPSAIALWFVLAFWVALFCAVAQVCLKRFEPKWAFLFIPVLWTGLEYFRSELYYLRFSWLNMGYAFSGSPLISLYHWLGMYGVGFLAAALVAGVSALRFKKAMLLAFRAILATTLALFLLAYFRIAPSTDGAKPLVIAGVQLEFPMEQEVLVALDGALISNPSADLFVLSEYTFDGPVPEKVRAWCREHQRYLVVGGKDPAPAPNFYDTAFVVDPSGEIVFRQVKSVPIQFFKDGLPATEQRLWESPWGKIGFCVCYDLSYTRVIDRLVRLGAQAIIVPTMDVVDWGKREHELHARVAPVRSAEYGIPIFRVASSGISQWVDAWGVERARAGFPGQKEMLNATLFPAAPGALPFDRWLAPLCSGMAGMLILWQFWASWAARTKRISR